MRWRFSRRARTIARKRGLILVDTKYEFGIDERAHRARRRDPYPGLEPLLVRRELPGFGPASGRRVSTRISCAPGSSPAATPIRTTSRRSHGSRDRDHAGLYRGLRTDHRTDLCIAGSGRAGAGAGAGEFEGVFLKLVDVSASHPYFALHDHRSHHFHELFYAVPIGRLRSVATRRSMPPLSGGIFIW